MNLAQEDLNKSIDTKVGRPRRHKSAGCRRAKIPTTSLATIKKFYPDAIPVEVFDPESGGGSNFGRGNFIITNPETGKLSLFDEDAYACLVYQSQRFGDYC